MNRLVQIVLLTVLLSACSTIGSKFAVERVDELQPGVTTVAQAKEMLGTPVSESGNADGSRLVTWHWAQGTPFGAKAANVRVLFDESGKMLRVAHKGIIGM